MFACVNCGQQYKKWQGQCGSCGQWNAITQDEHLDLTIANKKSRPQQPKIKLQKLANIIPSEEMRFSSGMPEFDRVIGGGFVTGSVLLLGGQPGAGKSTIILQILAALSAHMKALYISGEESVAQIAMRAHRMGFANSELPTVAATNIESVIDLLIKEKPSIVVIDSIQMMASADTASPAGSVVQVRTCANMLISVAKQLNICMLLIGHVTKDGSLAGPKVLEHCVDASLVLETMIDSRYRSLRVYKNRYGPVDELGIFAMLDSGMKAVRNPSAIFLSSDTHAAAGTVTTVIREGNLPLLIELQALAGTATGNNFQRHVSVGIDNTRLAMLLAVCDRHAGISFSGMDIFINVVGGMKITETAADLAIIAALVSSLRNQLVANGVVLFGEVGLTGEVRPVPFGQERLKEAYKHGFHTAFVARKNLPKTTPSGIKVHAVASVAEFLEKLYAS